MTDSEGAAMMHEQTVADCIIEAISRSPGCFIEELTLDYPGVTWNQVFIEVDRMNRDGRLHVEMKGPGAYILHLPASAEMPGNA